MKYDMLVSESTFSTLKSSCSASNIVDRKNCQIHTVFGKKIVVTGVIYDRRKNDIVFAFMVVHLSKYTGPIEPLEYGAHFSAVDDGLRERSYSGMKITYKGTEWVCIGKKITIGLNPRTKTEQIKLFTL